MATLSGEATLLMSVCLPSQQGSSLKGENLLLDVKLDTFWKDYFAEKSKHKESQKLSPLKQNEERLNVHSYALNMCRNSPKLLH